MVLWFSGCLMFSQRVFWWFVVFSSPSVLRVLLFYVYVVFFELFCGCLAFLRLWFFGSLFLLMFSYCFFDLFELFDVFCVFTVLC